MLCTLQDFFKYWPDFTKTYDKITVQPKSEEDKGGFVIRKFTVTGEQVIAVCFIVVTPYVVTVFMCYIHRLWYQST